MEHFSTREELIIKIMGRRKMTLEQISSELFKNDPYKPLDGDIMTANTVRRIIKKCEYHKLPWTLVKTRIDKKLTIRKRETRYARQGNNN